MKHPFIASHLEIANCATCKKSEQAHGDNASCECCDYTGPDCDIFMDMVMCPVCICKEQTAIVEAADAWEIVKAQKKVEAEQKTAIEKALEVDYSVEVRTDLFNAAIVPIIELKKLIDEDSTIQLENKHFELTAKVMERIDHLSTTIFDMDEEKLALVNERHKWQVQFNELSSRLSQEEKDKLKIKDINYQPRSIVIKKPKAPAKRKFDKVELRKYAAELGIDMYSLQMVVVSKGVSVVEAVEIIKKSIESAKAQSNEVQ